MNARRPDGEAAVEAVSDEFGAVVLTVRRGFALEPGGRVSVVLTPDEAYRLALDLSEAAASAYEVRDGLLRRRIGLAP